jgi:hypothetical protein
VRQVRGADDDELPVPLQGEVIGVENSLIFVTIVPCEPKLGSSAPFGM